ncbi:uncharacterized protein TNCV_4699861 [Trichonephila clavipes]|nr:uncharacterized protein TNCV_4699861 [Trichonephila clavipes]
MGTRLRALKLKLKGKKLEDKKSLGGRNRLTDAEVDKLQRYYGLITKLKVLDLLNIQPGFYTCRALQEADHARIRKAEKAISRRTKEARIKNRQLKCRQEDDLADDPSNPSYGSVVKRSHILLVCACATTIHKSQGSTFPEIVYEYEKHHSQSLLYVALSRVTSIEGLYITTPNNDKTFYHGRRTSTSTIDLQAEFKRLSLNKLATINEHLIEFMNNRRGLSLFAFNCQNLRAHIDYLDDSIVKNSSVLVLSETWLNNESEINITNFKCIAKFKRPNTRAGGVGIYHNSYDVVNIVTSSIDFSVFSPDFRGSLA